MRREHKPNIGTELLRTLVTVAEYRSYKQAANALRLSQPTISGHMRRLQEQLGVDLFDKRVPGVRLTAAGEATVAKARQIMDIHDDIFDHVVPGMSSNSGVVLKIGCPHELRCWSLVPVIAELRRTFPRAQVALHNGSSSEILEQVRSGELHMCAAVTTERQPDVFRSVDDKLVWFGNGKPLAIGEDGLPIVAPPHGTVARDLMFAVLDDHGMSYTTTFQAVHIDGVIEAVKSGLGYTALLSSFRPDNDEELVPVESHVGLPALPPIEWGIYVTPLPIDGNARSMATFVSDRIAALMPRASLV